MGARREPTLAALDELLRHRLIVEGAGGASGDYAFTHHKIQEVVYAAFLATAVVISTRESGWRWSVG